MNNNKVISIRQNIKLKAIQKSLVKSSFIENSNRGVIDIETYKSFDPTVFYINNKLNTDILVWVFY